MTVSSILMIAITVCLLIASAYLVKALVKREQYDAAFAVFLGFLLLLGVLTLITNTTGVCNG